MGEIRKYTSEMLMRDMGLQVGDRIKWNDETYTIIKLHNSYFLDANQSCWTSIAQLIDEDYEILPRPKRVGDEYCKNIDCNKCPLKCLCMGDVGGTLYDSWEQYKKPENMAIFDQEIYDFLKARLDKEVE